MMNSESQKIDENAFTADHEVTRTVRKLQIEPYRIEDPRELSSPTTELLSQFEHTHFDVLSPHQKTDFASPCKPRALRFSASPMHDHPQPSELVSRNRVSKRNREPLKEVKAAELNSALPSPTLARPLSDEKNSDFVKPQPSPTFSSFLIPEFPSIITAKSQSPASHRLFKRAKSTTQFSFDELDTNKLFASPPHFLHRSYAERCTDTMSNEIANSVSLDSAPTHMSLPLFPSIITTTADDAFRRTASSPPELFDASLFLPRPSDPATPIVSPRASPKSHFTPEQLAAIPEPAGILPCNIQNCVKYVSCDTVAKLIKGDFKEIIPKYVIIDCRYDYEYKGGHITGAINVNLKDDIQTLFDKLFYSSKNLTVIFHCEFSQNRGPKTCKYFRAMDRESNEYPQLTFPELVVMEGGYRRFHEEHPELCKGKFVSMWDENFQDECRLETARNRKSWDAKAPPKKLLRRQNSIAVSTPTLYETDEATGIHKRPSIGSGGSNRPSAVGRPSISGSGRPSTTGRPSGLGLISESLNSPRSEV